MNPAVAASDFSPPVRWLLVRSAVALVVIAAGGAARAWTVAGLIACVWIDVIAGWHGRRAKWCKTRFADECETLADFLCFVWAPVSWVTAGGAPLATWFAAGVFVLAGTFRLARFRVEGLVRGGYRGLPVTYTGYIVPAIGGLVATVLPHPVWVWPVAFVALALALVSTRFIVPEL